ncbi:hypothetical protein [Neptunitalea chrysea]|nr:hypothetical protein [Neptunitalea chrysea]
MSVVKIIAILNGSWLMPNLLIAFGLLLLGGAGFGLIKKDTYSLIYVIIGIVLISALRYYEVEWVVWLHEVLD